MRVDRMMPGFRLIVVLARSGRTEEAENLRKKALETLDDSKIREAGK